MSRLKIAAAFLAALVFCANAHAIGITWVGGGTSAVPTEWDLGDNFLPDGGVATDAVSLFGSDMGWRFQDAMLEDPDVTIGDGSYVAMDQGIVGDFHWQSSPNDMLPAHGGSITISGGSTLSLDSNVAQDGEWGVFDADLLRVTGQGSTFERARNKLIPGGTAGSGGAWIFGSWDGYEMQNTAIEVLDRGQYHVDGQQWFGAYGDNSPDINVSMTVGNGATATFRNGRPNDPIGTYVSHDDSACNGVSACGDEGTLNFVYGYDGGPKNETYMLNFTGHGGSITVDSSGIWIQDEDDTGGGPLYTSTQVTYEELYNGVMVKGANTQILKASGSNAELFGDVFRVSTVSNYFNGVINADGSTASSNGRKLTSIQEAGAGQANEGDITGDFAVNAVDFGIASANWESAAVPGTLVSQGDIAGGSGARPYDDAVNSVDAGVMFGAWTGDPVPAGAGEANAEYNVDTGEIKVSVNGVNNWYIESLAGGLTGDAPNLPGTTGSLVTDNNNQIGETSLNLFSYGTGPDYLRNLGNVALPDLAFGDLAIWSNAGLGQQLLPGIVSFIPEPSSLMLVAIGLAGLFGCRRRHCS